MHSPIIPSPFCAKVKLHSLINFSKSADQYDLSLASIHAGRVRLSTTSASLGDFLTGDIYDRSGNGMRDNGLYVDLGLLEFSFLLFKSRMISL